MLLAATLALACPAGGAGVQHGPVLPADPGGAALKVTPTLSALEGTTLTLDDLLAVPDAQGAPLDEYAAVDAFARGFTWADADRDDPSWMPQGLAGGFEAAGQADRMWVAWYAVAGEAADGAGVRLSVVDLESLAYTEVLLVDGSSGLPAPIPIHAGGIVWVGDTLYVADTTRGVRVFDLAGLREADPALAYGHRFVLPQSGLAEASGCELRFSFLSYDIGRGELLSGTFSDTDPDTPILAWPLEADGALAAETPAAAAWIAQQTDLQGVLRSGDDWWRSSSLQQGKDGALYASHDVGSPTVHPWPRSPEALTYDPDRDELWSQTERLGHREVFAVTPPRVACGSPLGVGGVGALGAVLAVAGRRRHSATAG